MKRWPIIRHIRWYCQLRRVRKWYIMWADMGYHSGNMSSDERVLDAIWSGKA